MRVDPVGLYVMNSTEFRRNVLCVALFVSGCPALLGQQLPPSEIERWNRIYKEEPDRIRVGTE
jgi:hypothetical protein